MKSDGVARRPAAAPRHRRWPVAMVVLAVAVAAALALPRALEPPAPPVTAAFSCLASVSSSAPIDRVAGVDRFATAACTSEVAYPDGSDHALLARGDRAGGLADALAGAVLARAVDGPLLLTEPQSLPEATRAELARLAPARVTVLGGVGAVAPEVLAAVEELGAEVDRVDGRDRFATAAAVSARAGAAGTAYLVNGFRPPDALVAAAPAARAGAKLLLATADTVPDATWEALADVERVVLVGGYGVLSQAVEDRVADLVGAGGVERLSGGNRFETAAAAARLHPGRSADGPVGDPGVTDPVPGLRLIASGDDVRLVDAATAGWAGAMPGGGPVLYSQRDVPGPGTDRYLRLGGLGAGEVRTRLVGGPAALSGALVQALESRYDEAREGGPPPQVRAVWVHLFDASLKTPAGIDAVLDAAAGAGLNTVVVQVSRRQDAYYDSLLLPRTPDPGLRAGLDVLGRLVPAARARGLQVHAWLATLPAYHHVYDGLTLPPDHVWVRHGPGTTQPWVSFDNAGGPGTMLDPGVPGVQDHVAAMYAEVAARYDVDAVHLDYLRYDGSARGYNPVSLARYREVTGATGTPGPADPAWEAWRRRQTHELARRVFLEVARSAPSVAVTMAASTMGASPSSAGGYQATRTYRDVFQDWPAWLSETVLDAAYPMNYFRDSTPEHRRWFDEWVDFESGLDHARLLAVGQAAYLNPVPDSLRQLGRAAAATDGFVVYSYQQNASTGAPGGLLPALAAGQFRDPAPPPPMPWRQQPTTGHILARVTDGVTVTASPVAGGPEVQIGADATGRAGFVGLAPGAWVVSAPGRAPQPVNVVAGRVADVSW